VVLDFARVPGLALVPLRKHRFQVRDEAIDVCFGKRGVVAIDFEPKLAGPRENVLAKFIFVHPQCLSH
jgi:hypothetical protein